MHILGIDFGGSGIKGAPVNVENGELLAPRFRLPTPIPSKPRKVANTILEIVKHFDWQGPLGCGYPGVVLHGTTLSAANVHKEWIGLNAADLIQTTTGCPTCVMNDADAAGLAEMQFGAGRGRRGLVLLVTIGTGLGTALFIDGHLVPNCEFGHIEIECEDAEIWATDAARQREHMSWKKWAKYFDRYLLTMEKLITPELIILGGGISKQHERFLPYLTVRAEVIPAQLLNDAGIVGAALAAQSSCFQTE